MFVLTALVYPGVLAALCIGAGLLVDRGSGGLIPGTLLVAVGAATLIAVSQLTTYVSSLAPATPYLMVLVAVAGVVLARRRVLVLARGWRAWRWQLGLAVVVYVLALAPVLLAGRPTFSSFMALSDSAVHMMGADFLLHHGQSYSHLDLGNSYGRFIKAYYGTSYPSGADTLFGGSALLLKVPLIWAFQPFNAFMLASASPAAWLLIRRTGLEGGWAALGALSVTLPPLVYTYELIGSVKEITALPMILTLGVLVVDHRRWLRAGPSGGLPFALVVAAGVSSLGVGFGAWALAAAAVLLAVATADVRAGRQGAGQVLALVATGAMATLVAAWPTWIDLSGALRVTQNIAASSNPGNLHRPLRVIQVFGTWLHGSYKELPVGVDLQITYVLVAIAAGCALVGVVYVVRAREYALAGWLAMMLAAWLAVSSDATTWVEAKTLMLTSPVVALMAWGGVGGLRVSTRRGVLRGVPVLLALALAGGAVASDADQYHSSNLAPTARYEELSSINRRFAGQGPTLFTDFDEYALYELRDLDIGGPDFVYPPTALTSLARGYGDAVDLNRAPPEALSAYPLIITRRDPLTSRPPAAYRLAWQGAYYQVWKRRSGVAVALAHRALEGGIVAQCREIRYLVATSAGLGSKRLLRDVRLVAAPAPEVVSVSLKASIHPRGWGHQREGLVMSTAGRLSAKFDLPSAGRWEIWVQGQLMPTVELTVDGRAVASIAGQLSGNSLVPDTIPPDAVTLSKGAHDLLVIRKQSALAPGDGGSAVLDAIFLTLARGDGGRPLKVAPASRWAALCGERYQWVELLAG